MEIQQQNLHQLKELLDKIEAVYRNLNVQSGKIEDINAREKIKQEIETQTKLVKLHSQQASQYQQQLPTTTTLKTASVQAKQLADNQQQISDTILQCRITQAKQFLHHHQQLHSKQNTNVDPSQNVNKV